MNILKKANKIVNKRSEEKERQYGNFDKSMELVARIFNAMTNDKFNVTAEEMYIAMIAMKFARQANRHKEDNLLDAVAYIGAWNNYIENKEHLDRFNLKFEPSVKPEKPLEGILEWASDNDVDLCNSCTEDYCKCVEDK